MSRIQWLRKGLLVGVVATSLAYYLTVRYEANKAAKENLAIEAYRAKASEDQLRQLPTAKYKKPRAFPKYYQLEYYVNDEPIYAFIDEPKSRFNKICNSAEENNDYAKVLEIATRRRNTNPKSGAAAFNQGTALFYQGQYSVAVDTWKKAKALKPDLAVSVDYWVERTQKLLAKYPALSLPPVHWVQNDFNTLSDPPFKKAQALFAAKKWDEIEKEVQALTKSPKELPDGSWELTWFFGGLWSISEPQKTEQTWGKKRSAIQEWVQARPNSTFAKLILARCWVDGAWRARGDQFIKDTPPEALDLMDKRLKYALDYFTKSMPQLEKTPVWAAGFQQFSQIGGTNDDTYRAIVEKAAKKFPTYNNLAINTALHLEPRWSGEKGDWENFAAQRADEVTKTNGADAGDMLYARIVWGMQKQYQYPSIWDKSKASWPRTKRGFQALLKRYPNSISAAMMACSLAQDAGDFDYAAQVVLTNIKGQADSTQWDSLGEFVHFRRDILEHDFMHPTDVPTPHTIVQ